MEAAQDSPLTYWPPFSHGILRWKGNRCLVLCYNCKLSRSMSNAPHLVSRCSSNFQPLSFFSVDGREMRKQFTVRKKINVGTKIALQGKLMRPYNSSFMPKVQNFIREYVLQWLIKIVPFCRIRSGNKIIFKLVLPAST